MPPRTPSSGSGAPVPAGTPPGFGGSLEEVFRIVPAPAGVLWSCAGLVGLLAAVSCFVLLRERRTARVAPRPAWRVWLIRGVLVLLAGLQLLFLYTGYWSQNARVELGPEVISVIGDYGTERVPLDSIDVARARVVDAFADDPVRPTARTFGTGMPGWASGWFRLRNGDAALLYVSRGPRLHLPTSEGFSVLVTVEEPERLLEGLRARR